MGETIETKRALTTDELKLKYVLNFAIQASDSVLKRGRYNPNIKYGAYLFALAKYSSAKKGKNISLISNDEDIAIGIYDKAIELMKERYEQLASLPSLTYEQSCVENVCQLKVKIPSWQ